MMPDTATTAVGTVTRKLVAWYMRRPIISHCVRHHNRKSAVGLVLTYTSDKADADRRWNEVRSLCHKCSTAFMATLPRELLVVLPRRNHAATT